MTDELRWMSEEEFQRMAANDLKNLSATVRVNPGKLPFEQMTDPTYLQPAIEPDLEFMVCTYTFTEIGTEERDRHVELCLTEGWQIDDKIICPPFVMLILSREKGKE